MGGALRWLWNLAHEQRLMGLARTSKRYPSYEDQAAELTLLRAELPWLHDLPVNVCQQLLKRLDAAWQKCFRKKGGRPRFKAKSHDGIGLCEPGKRVWRLDRKHGHEVLTFPKLGYVPVVLHRALEGEPATATITRDGHQWFVSIVCHLEVANPMAPTGEPVGIDRGVANLVADSTGHLEPRPAFLDHAEAKIAKASKNLSRKKKGSKNRAKTREVLAAVYRAVVYGSQVMRVPAAYSSQTCAACGHVDGASRPSQDRFCCTGCGHEEHADLNAARVLRQRYEELSTRRAGGEDVCGDDAKRRPLKQKLRSVRTKTPSPDARAQSPVVHDGDGLPVRSCSRGQA